MQVAMYAHVCEAALLAGHFIAEGWVLGYAIGYVWPASTFLISVAKAHASQRFQL